MGCELREGPRGLTEGGKTGLLRDVGLLVKGWQGAVERMSVRA